MTRDTRTRRRRSALGAVVLALACATAASATPLRDAATGAKRASDISVSFSNIAETPTLDPAVAFSSDGFEFVRNVYEGLLEYVPGGVNVRPLLATSWKVSPDGLTYTFTLRTGVKFQDGSPFNAAAAKLGLDRMKGVNQGPATLMANVVSTTAKGANTLVIKLKQPDVYFLGKLPKLPIVSAQAINAHKTASDKWATKWFGTHSAGTGPYQLDSWQRNSAINLKKYAGYWRPFQTGTPTIVKLRVDPDVQTALQLLARGQIDMMGAVGPDDSATAAKLSGVKLVKSPSYLVQTVPLNVTSGPLKDPRVREAIALAFDYKSMQQFYKGYATGASGPLPSKFSPELAKLPLLKTDVAKAKTLMSQAGYAQRLHALLPRAQGPVVRGVHRDAPAVEPAADRDQGRADAGPVAADGRDHVEARHVEVDELPQPVAADQRPDVHAVELVRHQQPGRQGWLQLVVLLRPEDRQRDLAPVDDQGRRHA